MMRSPVPAMVVLDLEQLDDESRLTVSLKLNTVVLGAREVGQYRIAVLVQEDAEQHIYEEWFFWVLAPGEPLPQATKYASFYGTAVVDGGSTILLIYGRKARIVVGA